MYILSLEEFLSLSVEETSEFKHFQIYEANEEVYKNKIITIKDLPGVEELIINLNSYDTNITFCFENLPKLVRLEILFHNVILKGGLSSLRDFITYLPLQNIIDEDDNLNKIEFYKTSPLEDFFNNEKSYTFYSYSNLKSITLSYNSRTNIEKKFKFNLLPKINDIEINSRNRNTSYSFKNLTELKHIKIQHFSNLILGINLPCLESLDLESVDGIIDKNHNMEKLKILKINSRDYIFNFDDFHKNLENLDILCHNVNFLMKNYTNLRFLKIDLRDEIITIRNIDFLNLEEFIFDTHYNNTTKLDLWNSRFNKIKKN